MTRLAAAYRALEAGVQESAFAWGVLAVLVGVAIFLALTAWGGE